MGLLDNIFNKAKGKQRDTPASDTPMPSDQSAIQREADLESDALATDSPILSNNMNTTESDSSDIQRQTDDATASASAPTHDIDVQSEDINRPITRVRTSSPLISDSTTPLSAVGNKIPGLLRRRTHSISSASFGRGIGSGLLQRIPLLSRAWSGYEGQYRNDNGSPTWFVPRKPVDTSTASVDAEPSPAARPWSPRVVWRKASSNGKVNRKATIRRKSQLQANGTSAQDRTPSRPRPKKTIGRAAATVIKRRPTTKAVPEVRRSLENHVKLVSDRGMAAEINKPITPPERWTHKEMGSAQRKAAPATVEEILAGNQPQETKTLLLKPVRRGNANQEAPSSQALAMRQTTEHTTASPGNNGPIARQSTPSIQREIIPSAVNGDRDDARSSSESRQTGLLSRSKKMVARTTDLVFRKSSDTPSNDRAEVPSQIAVNSGQANSETTKPEKRTRRNIRRAFLPEKKTSTANQSNAPLKAEVAPKPPKTQATHSASPAVPPPVNVPKTEMARTIANNNTPVARAIDTPAHVSSSPAEPGDKSATVTRAIDKPSPVSSSPAEPGNAAPKATSAPVQKSTGTVHRMMETTRSLIHRKTSSPRPESGKPDSPVETFANQSNAPLKAEVQPKQSKTQATHSASPAVPPPVNVPKTEMARTIANNNTPVARAIDTPAHVSSSPAEPGDKSATVTRAIDKPSPVSSSPAEPGNAAPKATSAPVQKSTGTVHRMMETTRSLIHRKTSSPRPESGKPDSPVDASSHNLAATATRQSTSVSEKSAQSSKGIKAHQPKNAKASVGRKLIRRAGKLASQTRRKATTKPASEPQGIQRIEKPQNTNATPTSRRVVARQVSTSAPVARKNADVINRTETVIDASPAPVPTPLAEPAPAQREVVLSQPSVSEASQQDIIHRKPVEASNNGHSPQTSIETDNGVSARNNVARPERNGSAKPIQRTLESDTVSSVPSQESKETIRRKASDKADAPRAESVPPVDSPAVVSAKADKPLSVIARSTGHALGRARDIVFRRTQASHATQTNASQPITSDNPGATGASSNLLQRSVRGNEPAKPTRRVRRQTPDRLQSEGTGESRPATEKAVTPVRNAGTLPVIARKTKNLVSHTRNIILRKQNVLIGTPAPVAPDNGVSGSNVSPSRPVRRKAETPSDGGTSTVTGRPEGPTSRAASSVRRKSESAKSPATENTESDSDVAVIPVFRQAESGMDKAVSPVLRNADKSAGSDPVVLSRNPESGLNNAEKPILRKAQKPSDNVEKPVARNTESVSNNATSPVRRKAKNASSSGPLPSTPGVVKAPLVSSGEPKSGMPSESSPVYANLAREIPVVSHVQRAEVSDSSPLKAPEIQHRISNTQATAAKEIHSASGPDISRKPNVPARAEPRQQARKAAPMRRKQSQFVPSGEPKSGTPSESSPVYANLAHEVPVASHVQRAEVSDSSPVKAPEIQHRVGNPQATAAKEIQSASGPDARRKPNVPVKSEHRQQVRKAAPMRRKQRQSSHTSAAPKPEQTSVREVKSSADKSLGREMAYHAAPELQRSFKAPVPNINGITQESIQRTPSAPMARTVEVSRSEGGNSAKTLATSQIVHRRTADAPKSAIQTLFETPATAVEKHRNPNSRPSAQRKLNSKSKHESHSPALNGIHANSPDTPIQRQSDNVVQRMGLESESSSSNEPFSAKDFTTEDIELLTTRIYGRLKRRLAVERERQGRAGLALWR